MSYVCKTTEVISALPPCEVLLVCNMALGIMAKPLVFGLTYPKDIVPEVLRFVQMSILNLNCVAMFFLERRYFLLATFKQTVLFQFFSSFTVLNFNI